MHFMIMFKVKIVLIHVIGFASHSWENRSRSNAPHAHAVLKL